LWRVRLDEKGTVYFYIAYGPGAHGSIMFFGKDKTGMGTMSWDFFVTRTPKHTYLNMIPLVEVSRGHVRPRPSKMYAFEEYRFSWRGQLVVSSVGGEVFQKQSKKGNSTVKPIYLRRRFHTSLRSAFWPLLRLPDPTMSS
jgi:hypothetical protein